MPGLGGSAAPSDAPAVDTAEQVYISSLALLKVGTTAFSGNQSFCNFAITKPVVCTRIMVEMGSHLTKKGSCSITQLLSRPKFSNFTRTSFVQFEQIYSVFFIQIVVKRS